MSIAAVSWALNEVRGLRAAEKAILIALADRADAEGYCFPSYKDITERSGAHRETVALALSKFEELGLIQRRRRYKKSQSESKKGQSQKTSKKDSMIGGRPIPVRLLRSQRHKRGLR